TRRHLDLDVDPSVVAQHLAKRLPDAVDLGIAVALVHLEAVVADRHAARVATAERDDVLAGLVRDDAARAELQVADDRADAEARRRLRVAASSGSLGKHQGSLLGMAGSAARRAHGLDACRRLADVDVRSRRRARHGPAEREERNALATEIG